MPGFRVVTTIKPSSRGSAKKLAELRAVRAEEVSSETLAATHEVRAEIQHRKWRVIHKLLRDNPFTVGTAHPRAEQWRRVRDHVKLTLDEPEVTEWVILQMEVAANRAAGIADLRPRKNGPCYALLMEFVRDRKRKALAVLRWTRDEGDPERPSFTAAKPPRPEG